MYCCCRCWGASNVIVLSYTRNSDRMSSFAGFLCPVTAVKLFCLRHQSQRHSSGTHAAMCFYVVILWSGSEERGARCEEKREGGKKRETGKKSIVDKRHVVFWRHKREKRSPLTCGDWKTRDGSISINIWRDGRNQVVRNMPDGSRRFPRIHKVQSVRVFPIGLKVLGVTTVPLARVF